MSRGGRQDGLSHVEVLLATLLLAASLVPALDALHAGIQAPAVHEGVAVQHHRLLSKLEEVLTAPLLSLESAAAAAGGPTVPTSFSDPVMTPNRRLVYLARYDADGADGDANPFTGGDAGLLWIRVVVEGTPHVIETLSGAD